MISAMNIAVVDRQLTFADSVANRLLTQADVRRATAHTSTDSLMATLHGEPVDVVLIDWGMCGSGDAGPMRALREAYPRLSVVVTSDHRDPAEIVAAMQAGALGWVPKDVPFDELLTGIRSAGRGERWIPGALLTSVFEAMTRAAESRRGQARALQPLTRREREVLQCMVDGLSRTQIATALGMSPNTVRTHVQSVLHKLGVHSSLRAVAMARQAGLVARTPGVPAQRTAPQTATRKD